MENLPLLPNCYVSVGHGSRGLISAHYGAKLISKLIVDKNSKIEDSDSVNPSRLLNRILRDLRKGWDFIILGAFQIYDIKIVFFSIILKCLSTF